MPNPTDLSDSVTYSIHFEGKVIGQVELSSNAAIQKRIGSHTVLTGILRPTEHYRSARKHAAAFAEFLASIARTGHIAQEDQTALEAQFAVQRFSAVDDSGESLRALVQVQEFSEATLLGSEASAIDEGSIQVFALLLEKSSS